jgi:hypothetical protein
MEFMAKRPLLCPKSIRLETRKQYMETSVWALALHASEAWTIWLKRNRKE